MRNYIVNATGLYDNDTTWLSADKTPEEVMFETIAHWGGNRASIDIMEVDTLEVVDPEGYGETPGDAYWDYLRDGDDGETAYGITRLACWEMCYHLEKM